MVFFSSVVYWSFFSYSLLLILLMFNTYVKMTNFSFIVFSKVFFFANFFDQKRFRLIFFFFFLDHSKNSNLVENWKLRELFSFLSINNLLIFPDSFGLDIFYVNILYAYCDSWFVSLWWSIVGETVENYLCQFVCLKTYQMSVFYEIVRFCCF